MSDRAFSAATTGDTSTTTQMTKVDRSLSKWRFALRRLALAPLVIFGSTLAVFIVVDLSPNDPARARLGMFSDAEAIEKFAAENGLNDPLPIRFWRFLVDLVHLRLGDSLVRPEPVGELIARALPVTFQLMIISAMLAVIFSLILGTAAAWKEGRLVDTVISALAAVFQASPQFWVGLLFIQLFAVGLGLLPSGGYSPMTEGFTYWFSSIIGPAIVLAIPFTAAMTRVVRGAMADELAKDYVHTAVGAGVSWPVVLGRNVLRNALVTPLTVLGLHIGALMTGAVLVETVFNVPGVGSLLITAVNQGDLAIVRAVAIIGATAFVLVNLLVDLIYLVLNPRSAEVSNQ